jgi:hypothetical protein
MAKIVGLKAEKDRIVYVNFLSPGHSPGLFRWQPARHYSARYSTVGSAQSESTVAP